VDDGWGDVIDNDTPVYTGVYWLRFWSTRSYATSEVTTQPHNYRYARLRVKNGTDIQTNDRIYDERLNQTWTITNISPLQNPVMGQDYGLT
jgi:hypothetical protein